MPDRVTLALNHLINKPNGLDDVHNAISNVKDVVDILGDAITVCFDAADASTNSETYVKILTQTIPYGYSNTALGISFQCKTYTQSAYNGYFKIYRNGGAVGTEMSNDDNTWKTMEEQIAGWSTDDTLELWAHRHSSISWATVYGRFVYAKVP